MTDPASYPQSRGVSGHAAVEVAAPVGPTQSRPSFDAVYEAEFPFVCNSLRRLGAGPPDVADLAQEVFVIVLRRLCDFDTSRALRPWLFGIAYRVLVDDRRLARHRREWLGATHDWNDWNGPKTSADGSAATDARHLVLDALRVLDVEQRAVLTLHDIEEFTMPQISEALQLPLNTGYSRLRLARERFGREVRRLKAKRHEVRP